MSKKEQTQSGLLPFNRKSHLTSLADKKMATGLYTAFFIWISNKHAVILTSLWTISAVRSKANNMFSFLHVGIHRRQAGKDISFPSRGSAPVWVRMRHTLSVPEWLSPVYPLQARLSMRISNINMYYWFVKQVIGAWHIHSKVKVECSIDSLQLSKSYNF